MPGPLVLPGHRDFPEEMEETGVIVPHVTVVGEVLLPFPLWRPLAPDLYLKDHQQEGKYIAVKVKSISLLLFSN